MKKVGIIIVNYNGWEDTLECLNTLLNINKKGFLVTILIIDNGSTNDSVFKIENWLLKTCNYNQKIKDDYSYNEIIIKFIRCNRNLGFSAGNNIGIEYCMINDINYICLLNNDTLVKEDFLLTLLNEKINKGYDMISGKIISLYKENEYFVGGYISQLKCSGYHFWNNDNINKPITFLSGCLLLFDISVVKKIGMLDEKYFMYIEDVDYSFRATKAGLKLGVNNNTVVFHKEGKSSKNKDVLVYYNTRNRLYFCNKNINFPRKIIFNIYFIMNRLFKGLNNPKSISYIVKGYRDFFKKRMGKYYE